ncbi:MAG: hypothetical protein CM15mP46_1920 [Alphaproteobacteria bacterium]|nr:MAG: hypothetical protein CM15mP46_1920 [Alphaproteobacteria bacterium]
MAVKAKRAWRPVCGAESSATCRYNDHIHAFFTFSGDVDWQQVAGPFEQVFLPMTIGGTVLAILSWLVAFVLCYYSLVGWRRIVQNAANGSKVARNRKKPGQ